ncbi:MAG: prolyl oligopeptidase family serine peptidase [Planctomycetales bacterium]|nr:prolyl oligopeptidase family serine peptidase [Planctomycetales bacterium]
MVKPKLVLLLLLCNWLGILAKSATAEEPLVRITNIRRVFHNGQHNAFTDLIQYQGRFYLAFRSCPDGHMVHPTSSIIVLASNDLRAWEKIHQFSVPLRDVRDPHFLEFQGRLFVYTGTWYCGETSPTTRDLNQHLGYCTYTTDGVHWSNPQMLEGTFGHYVWRASKWGDQAYLCGRRKIEFDIRPKGEGPDVESVMLASNDGLIWRKHSLFQESQGDETAFQFDELGNLLAVARRGRDSAELLRSQAPYTEWQRTDLGQYIGGPLLTRWGQNWFVGGRMNTPTGPRTSLSWLIDDQLFTFAQLPSDGDNSYPGFVARDDHHATISWYSSHERDSNGHPITAIYMADLQKSSRAKITVPSSMDSSLQASYLTVPADIEHNANGHEARPLVVSLHSWSANLEQRQIELERLIAQRGWFCLQPDFRGINQTPEACGSQLAQQDILDAVDWVVKHYPIDSDRIYLTGVSGGGHMTLLMNARFPERWTASSAWVGISDLAAWYERHHADKYGEMMKLVCGGQPNDSPKVREDYSARSPLSYLSQAKKVALDIAAGIHDGHSGSVPIRHSIDAFNSIAASLGAPQVSESEITQLSTDDGRLVNPNDGDQGFDPRFEREFYLRRTAGRSRLTIFEGGHEGIASAAMAWFDAHPTRATEKE